MRVKGEYKELKYTVLQTLETPSGSPSWYMNKINIYHIKGAVIDEYVCSGKFTEEQIKRDMEQILKENYDEYMRRI